MLYTPQPALNWVYVHSETLEVKHGTKTESIPHIVGPWDWTEDQEGVMLEDWEGFVAVEEEENIWALYYDKNQDGLASIEGFKGKKKINISLERKVLDVEGG